MASNETKHIAKHIARLGLDRSHFIPYRRYTDEDLAEAVRSAQNITGVLRHLGIKVAGGNHAHVARRIEALGLDVSHFKYGRPATPHAIRKTPSQILVRLPEGASRARPYQLRRALIESGRDYRCAECGLNAEWHGKPLVLQVEHLDGDWLNCLIENLCFLCPNCHSQTGTYAGRNRRASPDIA